MLQLWIGRAPDPKPQSYRRCYVCGSGHHLYRQCPRYTADSVSSGHSESTDQPSCLPVSVLCGLSVASGDEAVFQDKEENEIRASADTRMSAPATRIMAQKPQRHVMEKTNT